MVKYSKLKGTKQKILESAQEEFATYGFSGARVNRIVQRAGVNKALLFYYFSSKEKLYQKIIKDAVSELIRRIEHILSQTDTPERFFEVSPEVYIRFFSEKQYLVKMILFELIQNPHHITSLIRNIFHSAPSSPPQQLTGLITTWYEGGKTTEPDPVQFIMNIIPISIFWLLGLPMVESVLNEKIDINETFIQKRIQSVTNLLKRGMLK